MRDTQDLSGPVRIGVVGAVPLNTGDMAICVALSRAIRAAIPHVALEFHTSLPESARRYYPTYDWRPSLSELLPGPGRLPGAWRVRQHVTERRLLLGLASYGKGHRAPPWWTAGELAALRSFAGLTAVVSPGGTYLVDSYRLFPKLMSFRVAAQLNRPLVFHTQSVGPFSAASQRSALRPLLNTSPLVLLRDERSLHHLLDIGVRPDNLHVVADAAFDLGYPMPDFRFPASPSRWSLAVSVRAWPAGAGLDHPQVVRFTAALAEGLGVLLRDLPASVTLVSTCQGASEYWVDDSAVAMNVASQIPADVRDRVHVDRRFRSPAEFVESMRAHDLAISTRMHGAILALTAGTPVVPIAYEFKSRELFERLGLGEYVLDFSSLTSTGLVRAVRGFVDGGDQTLTTLHKGIRRERQSAQEGHDLLCGSLLAATNPGRVSRYASADEPHRLE